MVDIGLLWPPLLLCVLEEAQGGMVTFFGKWDLEEGSAKSTKVLQSRTGAGILREAADDSRPLK